MNIKEVWYQMISLGYRDNPWIMWEDRHVKVTIGERKIDKIYYLLNKEPEVNVPEYINFENTDDYTQYITENLQSFDDIKLGNNIVLGICGKFEVIKSKDPHEFKIEFVNHIDINGIQSNNSGE